MKALLLLSILFLTNTAFATCRDFLCVNVSKAVKGQCTRHDDSICTSITAALNDRCYRSDYYCNTVRKAIKNKCTRHDEALCNSVTDALNDQCDRSDYECYAYNVSGFNSELAKKLKFND